MAAAWVGSRIAHGVCAPWAVVPSAHDADPDPRLTASLAFPHWLCTEGMAG